jgi:hypothetical protein
VNVRKILRYLIVLEITVLVIGVAVAFAEKRFLPAQLQQYLADESESALTTVDWLFVAIGIPVVLLFITSWFALWRGWRTGRMLYTLVWAASLPFLALGAPFVTGPFASVFETSSCLISGLLLGLLYFSDLRHDYERKVS